MYIINLMKLSSLKAKTYNLKTAFTLIELLVVIAIIGLLSSIVLASLGTARDKAKDAAIMEAMTGIRTSAELYFGENGNSYDDATEYSKTRCLIGSRNGVTMSTTIISAIQYALNLGGFSTAAGSLCASNTQSYAVGIRLKTPVSSGTGCAKIYCVDSRGTSILTAQSNLNDTIIFSGTEYSCGSSVVGCTP